MPSSPGTSSLLYLVLKPVMRFCLRRSFRLQEIVEISKAALVDAAREQLKRDGIESSASKITVMTGVHRSDVTRLLRATEGEPATENLISRIIGQWQSDSRFSSGGNRPRVLSVDGRESEFSELVRSVTTALSPYTVLFELERMRAIERTKQGVKLAVRELVQHQDPVEAYQYLARDAADLMFAVDENVMSNSSQNLHLQTEYDKVSPRFVKQIRRWFIDEGNAFHARARAFLAKFDKDLNPKLKSDGNFVRISVCTFSRVDASNSKTPEPK